jgi:DNA-binding transcriptional regulator YhcF (GntR family)
LPDLPQVSGLGLWQLDAIPVGGVMKRKKHIHERYVALRYWLLKSLAWNSLPPRAQALYIKIAMRYNGRNNGMISYSVREAARELGVAKDTGNRALWDLEKRGFIICTRRGAFSLKTTRDATTWRLTEFDADEMPGTVAKHATKDFMRWTPGEAESNPVPKSKTRSDPPFRSVRPIGPYCSITGTVKAKNSANGPMRGTIEAPN